MARPLDHSLTSAARRLEERVQLTPEQAETTAQWLVALVLGGLIAWLYEPEDVDLEALVEGALPVAVGTIDAR